MAWNGSGGSATPPKKAKVSGTDSSSLFRGIAALLLVLVIGGVAYLFVTQELPKVNEPTEKKVEKKAIEVVEPEIADRTDAEETTTEEEKVVVDDKPKPLTAVQKRNRENGIRDFIPPAYTSNVTRVSHEASLFSNGAEQWIATFLTMEPGEGIVGDAEMNFGKSFRKHLEQAVVSKIEFSDDDSDYDREVKQAVIETKKELFERIRNGEDGCEIMKDTFNELQQLGLYKQELEQLVKQAIKDDGLSDQDVEDTLSAANKMLEDRGVSEIKMPGLFKARIRLNQKKGLYQ